MAKSRSAMLASCSTSDQGCCTLRRRAATAGCSAAIQKRSVETTSLRRDRSSRYSATDTAETAPKTAKNWSKERFRKYMRPLQWHKAPALCIRAKLGPGVWPFLDACAAWVGHASACQASVARPIRVKFGRPSCARMHKAEPYATGVSRDASHADQVAEDHAFQGLRGGDAGVAAAAAHRHRLQARRVLVKGARVPL